MPSVRCSTGECVLGVWNRGQRPGSTASGSVTLETAFAMVSLVVVFAMLLQGMSVVALNSALTSCAREAARAASLELDKAAANTAARAQVAHCHPAATLELSFDAAFVDATVSRRVHILGLPRMVTISSSASAMKEPTW